MLPQGRKILVGVRLWLRIMSLNWINSLM